MSLNYLKKALTSIEAIDSVSINLLHVKTTQVAVYYNARQVEILPNEELTAFIKDVTEKYTEIFNSTEEVEEYKGDIIKGRIYKLDVDNDLISANFRLLEKKLADPSTEHDVLSCDWSALLISGKVIISDEKKQIIIVFMKSPVSTLTNKFWFAEKNQFKKLSAPVLSLNKSIDAIIVNGTFYMLTMQAENLFNMVRSYRIRCNEKVQEIENLKILTNVDAFKSVATKGQNPRRFVSFNPSRLEVLKDKNKREKYMKMFNIAMKDDKIDTESQNTPERLVKFLCDKAMLDPIDEKPREVAAAKEWS